MKNEEIAKYIKKGDLLTWLYQDRSRGFGIVDRFNEWIWLESNSGLNPNDLVNGDVRKATESETLDYNQMIEKQKAENMSEERATTNETYCPCCASDYTEHQETNHESGKLVETFKCKYCGSTFNNEYDLAKTKVVEDKSEVMHMLKAKEVIVSELNALGDNISNSRGFADGRIYMLLDCLVNELNELDSEQLANTYKTSSFFKEYELTSK